MGVLCVCLRKRERERERETSLFVCVEERVRLHILVADRLRLEEEKWFTCRRESD